METDREKLSETNQDFTHRLGTFIGGISDYSPSIDHKPISVDGDEIAAVKVKGKKNKMSKVKKSEGSKVKVKTTKKSATSKQQAKSTLLTAERRASMSDYKTRNFNTEMKAFVEASIHAGLVRKTSFIT